MSRPTAFQRLFVAAYPPPEAAQAMLHHLAQIEVPGFRAVGLEQIHLTLLFLGDTPAGDVKDVRESIERSCAGPSAFRLTPAHLISLPERGRARLVACETDAPPPLLEIRRRLVTQLASQAQKRHDHPFRPHFTLCRFDHAADIDTISLPIDAPSFTIGSIRLVRSVLKPDGAEHIEIGRFALTGAM